MKISNEDIKEIEELSFQVLDLIKITRDSCGYNEYFTQEVMLDKAIEIQELLQEKLFNY